MRDKLLFSVLLVFTVSFCLTPLRAAAADAPPASGVLGEFPVDHWGEPVFIPVEWEAHSAFFVLDTGMGVTIVDSTVFAGLEPLKAKVNADTLGGKRNMQAVHPPDLHVGPFSLAGQGAGSVARIDLSDVRALTGKPVIGILGAPAMKNCVMQLDFDNRKVRFLRPDSQPHPEWGASLAVRLDRSAPSVRVRIGGVEEAFAVDTGSTAGIDLPVPAFDRLRDSSNSSVISAPKLTGNGTVAVRQMRVPDVEFAGARYHNLIYGDSKDAAGTIGLQFLERHLVTLDFPRNRLYLNPGKEFNHANELGMSGIHAMRDDKQLVARSVDAGSPAFNQGLREGDVIIALNGTKEADLNMAEIRDLMCAGDGTEMTVTYRRDAVEHTIKFNLKRAIKLTALAVTLSAAKGLFDPATKKSFASLRG